MSALAVMAAAVIQSACSDGSATAPAAPPPPARVATTITISEVGTLTDGDVRSLQATVSDQFGAVMPSLPVQWRVAHPALAAISETGVLTALAAGTTEVTATVAGKTASRPVVITLHPAARLELSHATLDVVAGATRQVFAAVRGLDGRALANRQVTWESNDPTVARVSPSGIVTPVAPGHAIIAARSAGAMAALRVSVVGFATRYEVTALDGRALPLTTYEERFSDEHGAPYQLIERLERGTVQVDGRYEVELVLGVYRQFTFQGNVIEQRIRQQAIRDRGALEYDWSDGSARFVSELVGGLLHPLRPQGDGLRLGFRIAGTNTTWDLSLRRTP